MTFWKKKKRPEVVGLDIGTSAVKVVELRPKGSAFELGGFGLGRVGVRVGRITRHEQPSEEQVLQAQLGRLLGDAKLFREARRRPLAAGRAQEEERLELQHRVNVLVDELFERGRNRRLRQDVKRRRGDGD